ncbi:hypothetical protein [Yersinia bercovieri]|uniref:Uncharacterized protein n=2 Tax=Yersinia bercovieri TaxID=634 RepID=A0A2G4U501_YERBE|nr:hypothetical protein [Yersinia bercovieri]EEQ07754.1 hypothetical protein yberc0001_33210 [Yersinia bercovieri ATCC 43970]PHZ27826.1 hypothetical protein CS533_08140 [Yersinia bercovieri]QKJ05907.1 hypothetical protein HRK25_02550 [Yersinia bercovieri ATCC 43970]CFQ39318.1 Uncharacterised protein [Yersinia bercovieri]
MADEIFPPSILYKRLYDEATREGLNITTYNKIIAFANSLNKADVEHFLWLADSTYPAYLKLKGLALSGNADAIAIFNEFNHKVSYRMSASLGDYHALGYTMGVGIGLTAFITIIMVGVNTVATGWLQTALKMTESTAKGVAAFLAIIVVIVGFVDRRVNYNDRVIKLIKKIMNLRLSGIKYLENIKEKHSNKKDALLGLINDEFKENVESRHLIILINTIFDNANSAECYKMPIQENWQDRKPIFCLNAVNGAAGESFYVETENLWNSVITRIGENPALVILPGAVAADQPGGLDDIVPVPRDRGDSVVQRRIRQFNGNA